MIWEINLLLKFKNIAFFFCYNKINSSFGLYDKEANTYENGQMSQVNASEASTRYFEFYRWSWRSFTSIEVESLLDVRERTYSEILNYDEIVTRKKYDRSQSFNQKNWIWYIYISIWYLYKERSKRLVWYVNRFLI